MRLFVLAIVALGICAIAYVRAPAHEDIARMQLELKQQRTDLAAVRARNRELARETALLRDNPDAIEKLARHRFSLVRPDEWVLPAATTGDSPRSALDGTMGGESPLPGQAPLPGQSQRPGQSPLPGSAPLPGGRTLARGGR